MVESFAIVPASSRFLWISAGVLVMLFAGVLALVVVSARGASTTRFELSQDGLRIRGDLYGRLIPRTALRGGTAQVVNLATQRDLDPVRRTMGTAVPGYHSGWFRLRNGRKALLYLTDRSREVHVPTTAGYDLLISPNDPDRFVTALRSIAPAM